MAVRHPRASRPATPKASRHPAKNRRQPATPRDSRQRILDAATTEFALRGFSAAGVDRIAARARLNKAMIYYHFGSKQNLYRAVLRDVFGAIGGHLEAIATSHDQPFAKINRFVEVLVREGQQRPHFAPIVLREIAEGGRRLDEETYTLMLRIVGTMMRIVEDGRAAGQFAPVDPVLLHLTTVWSIVLYLATEPIRSSIARIAHFDVARFEASRFIEHMQTLTRKALATGQTTDSPSSIPTADRDSLEIVHD